MAPLRAAPSEDEGAVGGGAAAADAGASWGTVGDGLGTGGGAADATGTSCGGGDLTSRGSDSELTLEGVCGPVDVESCDGRSLRGPPLSMTISRQRRFQLVAVGAGASPSLWKYLANRVCQTRSSAATPFRERHTCERWQSSFESRKLTILCQSRSGSSAS